MGIIRQMQLTDLDQIMAIEDAVQLHPWPKAAFQQAMQLNQFCIVYDNEGVIEAYGVSDRGHGRTIAATTVEAADAAYAAWLTAARSAGVDRLYAEIEVTNRAARIRLQRFGFQLVGVRTNFYGVDLDAQVWERETELNNTKENTAEGFTAPVAESA